MDRIIREQARLIMMRALAAEVGETLNSDLLIHHLRPFGIRKDRPWVHTELAWLQEIGAVTTIAAGSVLVATLTDRGARHLAREIAIEGIQRPSRPGG